jgi:uncharacterized protein (UPF0333 family)
MLTYCKQNVHRFKAQVKVISGQSDIFAALYLTPNLNQIKLMRKLLLLTFFVLTASMGAFAQGVTTASISGVVTNQKGETLPGATIVAVHQPTNAEYGTISREDGRFTIPNARVGGPYKLSISFVGYDTQEKNDVYLSLGNTTSINIQMAETGTNLQEVVVSASRGDVFNADRTGAATNVNNRTIQSVPTISRGLRDFTKLSPMASTMGNGTSFAGANNRYNQFAIDGLVNNDVFGLSSSGTNGGQSGIEPISLDAIEEFQINIAPYDVRQGGFTGGGINAVTRSGTNTFQGSAYYFGTNEGLVGGTSPNSGQKVDYPEFKDYQAGFRLGGPIIKNKLFFFVNGEIGRQSQPLAFVPGSSESLLSEAEVNSVVNVLNNIAPNYDPGSYTSIADETNSDKILAKLDWNISKNHKLTLRHSYTYGENIDNSRTNSQLRFYNNGVYFPSTTNSTGIELNSIFGTKSNRLLLGYTTVKDDREPLGSPFPSTTINLTNPTRSIVFGGESSSVANQLDQNIFTLTDDFTLFKGKHTITIGTHNEFYKFYNLFVQRIYGDYLFRSLADFETLGDNNPLNDVNPVQFRYGYSFEEDGISQSKGAAEFNAFQIGLYVQDEFQVSDKFKLTYGIRFDVPIFPDTPKSNQLFNDTYGSIGKTGEVPKTRVMYSPRVGFNLDVMGDKSLQLRGGVGLFTGRVPFVWVSNQFTNNGELNGSVLLGSSSGNPLAGTPYITDPANQASNIPTNAVIGRGAINVIDEDFKFPQVFRTNLAVDKQLPWGLIGTIEAIYSKTYNNINFTNLNRVPQEGFQFAGPDKRPRFTTVSTNPTTGGYVQAGRVDGNFEDIIKLSNTNEGYSYNVMFQLQKQFDHGFSGSVAYTYGDAKDLNSGTSSVAASNWQFVSNVNGLNNLPLARANFSMGSRIVGLVSYRKEYLNNQMATQVSLFYNGQSGQPFSYRYSNDLNFDGTSNDLVYIPRDASEINLVSYNITVDNVQVPIAPEEQWAALDAFIKQDSYLSERRGQYAERNGARMPFQHQFDFRLLQEFGIKTGSSMNKLQLSVDILNVGNLINDEWGKQYNISNQEFAIINIENGILTDTAPGAALDYSSNTPRYTYRPALTNGKAWTANDLFSRWRMQLGIRYIFN